MIIGDRRSILAGLGGAVAAAATAPALANPRSGLSNEAVKEVTETYLRANEALMRGDVGTYNRLVRLAEDFVLMAPVGGEPSRFADYTPERFERMGRFFRNGTFRQEIVETYATSDMIVLATIERCHVEVGGLPAQEWPLRVTSVFTSDGSRWLLAHRHADPLVEDVPLAEAARLARGERMPASN